MINGSGNLAAEAGRQKPLMLGVRRQDWRGREMDRALGRRLADRGEIAYWVSTPERCLPSDRPDDRRAGTRARTRLRSAKLLDGAYRFLCESRICDRSSDGLRLMLSRDVALPRKLAVHIDETSEVREAKVVWRRGSTIGIRLNSAAPANALKPCDRYALKERYYAVPA
jgi:hypothetical protein